MEGSLDICCICQNTKVQPIAFDPCTHSVCLKCFTQLLQNANAGHLPRCPLCRNEVECIGNDPDSSEYTIAGHLLHLHMTRALRRARPTQRDYTPEEVQMAQQEMDRQFAFDMHLYKRDEVEGQALKALDVLLPMLTYILFCLTLIPVAGLGYIPMIVFSGFVLSHVIHQKIMEKIRVRNNRHMALPQRQFVNQNVVRLLDRPPPLLEPVD